MGCSSGRQHPAPVLHPDLDCSNSGEANTLPQDSDNQNQGLNGLGEGGDGDGSVGRDHSKAPETLPTLERLAQATGGTEKSWYRCVFPFGVISLVIGDSEIANDAHDHKFSHVQPGLACGGK
ncbi:hypothetical protein Q5P01_023920 [Channa striata]|uniref:Uncharacterized protein n=1 Tax=Channa striata TaxID=64152 RepID=A0AA88ITZ1_CHASR|nr:hypothetical protein Q5P01_023920 [Channa striata]